MGYHSRYYRISRGDPGFFDALKGIVKTAVGFIPGVGPIVQGVANAVIPTGPKPGGGSPAKQGVSAMLGNAGGAILGAVGAGGVLGTLAGVGGTLATQKLLRGRGTARAAGGRRRRRMNPANGRALKRAVRRIQSGARVFHSIYGMSRGHVKGAHGVRVKFHRRKRAA